MRKMENKLLLLMLEERSVRKVCKIWSEAEKVNSQHLLVPCNVVTRQHLMEYIEEYKSIERFFKKCIRSVNDY